MLVKGATGLQHLQQCEILRHISHIAKCCLTRNKANLRDLIAATSPVILLKLDSSRWFFSPCDLKIQWMTSWNNRAPLLYHIKLCASFQIHWWIQIGVGKCKIRVKIGDFLSLVTLKFNGWPWKTKGELFPYYIKLCALFQSHGWIQTGVIVRKHSFRVKIVDILDDLEKNRTPLLYHVKLFHHFKAISEFKLELQSRNTQFGSKWAIFCRVWPWNLKDDIGKQQGTSSMLLQALCICFIAISSLELELQSGNTQFGSKSMIFCPVWPWNMTDDLEKQ